MGRRGALFCGDDRSNSEPFVTEALKVASRSFITPTITSLRSVIDRDSLVVIGGLGQGGFSDVVRVKNMESGKEYAMKVMSKKRLVNKDGALNHIWSELQVMTEMAQSPFLLRCHLSFESTTNVFFLMDLIIGCNLQTRMTIQGIHHFDEASGLGLPESECRIVLAELALALKHMHDHGYIHKDIKLENVMLDGNGHVKLIDFGLTEAIRDEVAPVNISGTISYLSPELIKCGTVGRHIDWWAYGVLAYELLSGYTPWTSLSDNLLIKSDILSLPIFFSFGVSKPAVTFLKGLLERNYKDRLGTISDHDVLRAYFFRGVDWEATARLEVPPLFLPDERLRSRVGEAAGSSIVPCETGDLKGPERDLVNRSRKNFEASPIPRIGPYNGSE